jgi:hypothetical protein
LFDWGVVKKSNQYMLWLLLLMTNLAWVAHWMRRCYLTMRLRRRNEALIEQLELRLDRAIEYCRHSDDCLIALFDRHLEGLGQDQKLHQIVSEQSRHARDLLRAFFRGYGSSLDLRDMLDSLKTFPVGRGWQPLVSRLRLSEFFLHYQWLQWNQVCARHQDITLIVNHQVGPAVEYVGVCPCGRINDDLFCCQECRSPFDSMTRDGFLAWRRLLKRTQTEHCPITGEPFRSETPISLLSCGHYAERNAMWRWLCSNWYCPVGRCSIKSLYQA